MLVEVHEDTYGVEAVRRGDPGRRADGCGVALGPGDGRRCDRGYDGIGFEELTLELGIKLSAEARSLIARTAAEGHMTVTARMVGAKEKVARLTMGEFQTQSEQNAQADSR